MEYTYLYHYSQSSKPSCCWKHCSHWIVNLLVFILLIINALIPTTSVKAQASVPYQYQQAVQSYQAENYQQAVRQLQEVLSSDSSRFEVYAMAASSYMRLKYWKEAIGMSKLGLGKFPDQVIFNWQLGEANLQLKRYEQSIAYYQPLRSITSLPSGVSAKMVRQRLGECHSQLGAVSVKQEKWVKAIHHFKKAVDLLPDQLFAYTNLTYAYANRSEWNEVIQMANSGLKRFVHNTDLLKAKASALYQLKDYKGTAQVYRTLYQQSPADIQTGIAYGELLMAGQDYATASAHYDQFIKANPKEKDIYESLIKIYEGRLNYQGKVELLQQMLVHFDQSAIYERLAETYDHMQNWNLARSYYDTLLTFDGVDEFYLNKKIARLYRKESNVSKALAIYQSLHEKRPDDEFILEQLGSCQEEMGLWKESLNTYHVLNEIHTSSVVLTSLGRVSEQLNLLEKAQMYYEQSLKEEETANALLGLSRVLQPTASDYSLKLAKNAFDITFKQLRLYENQLNQKLQGKNALNGLIDNENLIQRIKAEEQLATQVFYHLTTYPFAQVNQLIEGLAQQFPQSGKINFFIGEYKYQHSLGEESEGFLRKSLSLNPNQMEAHFLIGRLYEQSSRYHEGILSFERVLSLDNTNTKAYHRLINLYAKTDNLDQLCNKWMIRYRSNTDRKVLKPHLIEALHKAGRYDEAKEIIGEKP